MSSSDRSLPLSPAAVPVGTPAASASARGPVRAAIARAAAATGVDFGYLLAQARLESGLDPQARATTSSATGLFQFTNATWLHMLDRHGAAHGFDWASAPGAGLVPGLGAVRSPALAQVLALRSDPELSAMMAGELANDNRAALATSLGREPDNAELYVAHFLGPDGASRFLSALAEDPGQSAAALFPKAAAANRAIFFAPTGARSVGAVMDMLRTRLTMAMNAPDAAGGAYGFDPGEGLPAGGAFLPMMPLSAAAAEPRPVPAGGPLAQEFQAAGGNAAGGSMADTLRDAFGLADAGDSAVPAHVRAAYGQLRAFGL